ncbi:MAG: cupin domain-containing protein [Oscillospiraceae bacterium]|nr:cupin domain-containing protein [Oscillospiraceae bacterium]
MIRRSEEKQTESKKMFGGAGEAVMKKILNGADEMYGKGRVFNHVALRPGCEIGWHVHQGDGETYYILKGRGLYNDNGAELEVGPGDVTFVDSGEGHALLNNGDEDLEAIALILYKD